MDACLCCVGFCSFPYEKQSIFFKRHLLQVTFIAFIADVIYYKGQPVGFVMSSLFQLVMDVVRHCAV